MPLDCCACVRWSQTILCVCAISCRVTRNNAIACSIEAQAILAEGGHWAKAKKCSFLHERCNYSRVTSSNWTQPSQTDADLISYPSLCSDLDKSPWYRMTGLKAHGVHLYPRWVLSRGNGTIICIPRQPLALFAPMFLQ